MEATRNSVINNLGSKTNDLISYGEQLNGQSDHDRATFYIRSSENDFVGNVAAGSAGRGWVVRISTFYVCLFRKKTSILNLLALLMSYLIENLRPQTLVSFDASLHWAFYGEDEVQDSNAIGDKKSCRQKPMGLFRANKVRMSKPNICVSSFHAFVILRKWPSCPRNG